MTSLDPSHFPSRTHNSSRVGQAVYYDPGSASSASGVGVNGGGGEKVDSLSSIFQSTRSGWSHNHDRSHHHQNEKGERHGLDREHRPHRVGPVIPDLRFEQGYLLSIRPFLSTSSSSSSSSSSSLTSSQAQNTTSTLQPTPTPGHEDREGDEVIPWSKDIRVDWKSVLWITVRDQVFSPLGQGILWGFLGIFVSSFSGAARSALSSVPALPRPSEHGRIAGGPGGGTKSAGGGGAVGESGEDSWWRGWVRSVGGAVETIAV